MVGGGGRSGSRPKPPCWDLGPLGREEEGAIVGVLVQVGVSALRFRDLGGGQRRTCGTGRDLSQFVFELLHLPSKPLHRVGVVCRDGVGEGLRMGSHYCHLSHPVVHGNFSRWESIPTS